MGHISDRTLDNLLDGSIDDAGELAIEEHVRHCDRCAHRLREWELLFPQVRSLMPTGEHPVMAGAGERPVMAGPAAFAAPRAPAVFIPDWTPPRSPHAIPARLAWGLVVLLAAGAGYLLFQKTKREAPTIGYLPETYETASATTPSDSNGLGSGIPNTDLQVSALEAARIEQESALARARASLALDSATRSRTEPEQVTPTPPVETSQSAEQDVRVPLADRERPVTFPIKDSSARQPAREPAPADPSPSSAALSPLPTQFQRVTLGEAITRLAGTVRLIQGLNPEAVEIAQGSALPGADPGKAVVRVVYNAPEGRLIMDQQRLSRGGGSEPNIAISTAPNGVSVAQWVDRGGFWISLAGRADQQTLLAIANRIR